MMQNNQDDKAWIDKLIRFFKRMPGKKPGSENTDYSGWRQTEAEYQKEQAEWLSSVKARQRKKTGKSR